MLNEAETRAKLIDPKLHEAGWSEDLIQREVKITEGRIVDDYGNRKDALRPDYILFLSRHFPIAIVEAKDESHHPAAGLQQAKRYAQLLDVPFSYSTNGYEIEEYDYVTKKQRTLNSFPSPEDLWGRYSIWKFNTKLPYNREENPILYPFKIVQNKIPRYYQIAAVRSVIEAYLNGKRRILLTMATGTGKTYVAFQVAWKLYNTKKIRRILYIADRVILRNQAYNQFEPFNGAREVIKEGRAPSIRDIYFATYQTLYSERNGKRLYRNYSPDFFDMIIIDECHRSGYGRWREILDYFNEAVHLGMTATPKRDDNIDTYAYFGTPVYEYSLGRGIEDGFLAPYKIHKIYMNIDKKGGIYLNDVASEGAIINVPEGMEPKEFYSVGEFERAIILPDRTKTMTEKLAEILKIYGPMEKTIVFCVTKEHALDVVKILQNELASKLASTGINADDFVVRVVDEEPDVREQVDKMADPETLSPVIAVTVDLLSTGVDLPPVKNIVFMKPVASKVLFKQIMGRGSRISEDANKFFFRIIDFVDATRLLDPWDLPPPPPDGGRVPTGPFDYFVKGKVIDSEDGHPVANASILARFGPNLVKPARTDEEGFFLIEGCPHSQIQVHVEARNYRSREVSVSPTSTKDRLNVVIELKRREPKERKVLVKGIKVYIEEEIFVEVEGRKLNKARYIEYARENVRKKILTLDDLRKIWLNDEERKRFLEDLQKKSINPDLIARLIDRPDADAFDIIAHVAFDAPILSRDDRAQVLLTEKQQLLLSFNHIAREVILNLIEKYKLGGIDEISPKALETPDIQKIGRLKEIIDSFGGFDNFLNVLSDISQGLYKAGEVK